MTFNSSTSRPIGEAYAADSQEKNQIEAERGRMKAGESIFEFGGGAKDSTDPIAGEQLFGKDETRRPDDGMHVPPRKDINGTTR